MACDRPSLHNAPMTDGGDSREDTGARIELLCAWAGYGDNQSAFARRTGLIPSELNHVMRARRPLSLGIANKLRLQWRVTLDWLFHGDRSGLSVEVANSLPRLAEWRAGKGSSDPSLQPAPPKG